MNSTSAIATCSAVPSGAGVAVDVGEVTLDEWTAVTAHPGVGRIPIHGHYMIIMVEYSDNNGIGPNYNSMISIMTIDNRYNINYMIISMITIDNHG